VATVADPKEPAKSYHVVYLLDEDAAGWQVRNWLADQGNTLLDQRIAKAAEAYATGSTGTAALNVVKRLSTQNLNGPTLGQLLVDARLTGQKNPKLLWNGPLAAYRDNATAAGSYQSTVPIVMGEGAPEEVVSRCRTVGFIIKQAIALTRLFPFVPPIATKSNLG
jgi:hypothetical protein